MVRDSGRGRLTCAAGVPLGSDAEAQPGVALREIQKGAPGVTWYLAPVGAITTSHRELQALHLVKSFRPKVSPQNHQDDLTTKMTSSSRRWYRCDDVMTNDDVIITRTTSPSGCLSSSHGHHPNFRELWQLHMPPPLQGIDSDAYPFRCRCRRQS